MSKNRMVVKTTYVYQSFTISNQNKRIFEVYISIKSYFITKLVLLNLAYQFSSHKTDQNQHFPWYLYKIVTQNRLHTNEGQEGLFKMKNPFGTALELIKCLEQVRLRLTCAPIYEVISTMNKHKNLRDI